MSDKKKNKNTEDNDTKNTSAALLLLEKELNYEEKRNEWLNNKAATYIGFSSIVMALMINDNLKNSLEGHVVFSIPCVWAYDCGLVLIFISIVVSIYAYRIKSFKRPRVTDDGLLKEEIIEQDNEAYEQTIIKHFSEIVESNAEVNQSTAADMKMTTYFFLTGMFLIMISFIFR